MLEVRQLHHCWFSSISLSASVRRCSSSMSSSTSRSFRVLGSVTPGSGVGERFVSNCQLVFFEFSIQRGPADSEQVRGDGAIAFGVLQGFENSLPLHLGEWDDGRT